MPSLVRGHSCLKSGARETTEEEALPQDENQVPCSRGAQFSREFPITMTAEGLGIRLTQELRTENNLSCSQAPHGRDSGSDGKGLGARDGQEELCEIATALVPPRPELHLHGTGPGIPPVKSLVTRK